MKILKVLFVVMLMSSCTTFMLKDFDNPYNYSRSIDINKVNIGDSKREVINMFGSPDRTIGSKLYKDGVILVLEYADIQLNIGPDKVSIYWLYFLNDKLIQYGRPGDWQREADYIIDIRIK